MGPFYSALAAQRKADLRRRGSRKPRRMDSDRLRAWVLDSLRRGWSPELIEGRLKAQYAGDPSMRISHECLCQWIYAKPQRALDLRQYLARGRKRRTSVLLQCLLGGFGSVFPQCGLMVFPGAVIVSR